MSRSRYTPRWRQRDARHRKFWPHPSHPDERLDGYNEWLDHCDGDYSSSGAVAQMVVDAEYDRRVRKRAMKYWVRRHFAKRTTSIFKHLTLAQYDQIVSNLKIKFSGA